MRGFNVYISILASRSYRIQLYVPFIGPIKVLPNPGPEDSYMSWLSKYMF